jgi:hypothetical protein
MVFDTKISSRRTSWSMAKPYFTQTLEFTTLTSSRPLDIQPLAVISASNPKRLTQLIDQGANVDPYNKRGFSALHRAVEEGDMEMVRIMLTRGSNTAALGPQGFTRCGEQLNWIFRLNSAFLRDYARIHMLECEVRSHVNACCCRERFEGNH